jgi:hypothetical protein
LKGASINNGEGKDNYVPKNNFSHCKFKIPGCLYRNHSAQNPLKRDFEGERRKGEKESLSSLRAERSKPENGFSGLLHGSFLVVRKDVTTAQSSLCGLGYLSKGELLIFLILFHNEENCLFHAGALTLECSRR